MDTGSSSSPRQLHLVIFPWLAFGHLLPYMELTERLASRGHRVSFVSTPRNIARLPPVSLSPAAVPLVDLVALPLPHVDGLPDGTECTNDVPSDKFELLWKAFDCLGAPFAEFLAVACADEGRRPDWVIADTFHHWAPLVALQHKVPCAMLLPSASMMAGWATRSTEPAGVSIFELLGAVEERRVGVPRYEWEQKASFFISNGASGMCIAERCSLTMERCMLAAMRSCPQWELEPFRQVAMGLNKPLIPLGLLPPSADGARRRASMSAGEEDSTLRWLDAQPPASVVYVALGSEVPLRVELVHELALGLELAGTRFLWALRKPRGVEDADVLPPGFQERTHGHGLVTMVWVPQITILAHDAVGAFLTHCGRNSLVEGLLFGNPLIMLPIFADQGPNARLMEGKEVGLQVTRDDKDGSFERHGVATAIRAVMLDEDARRIFVANALKLQEIVADKELHERYIDEFIQQLTSYTVDGNSSTAAPAPSS